MGEGHKLIVMCGRGEGDVVCGRGEGDEWQRRSDTVELYKLNWSH